MATVNYSTHYRNDIADEDSYFVPTDFTRHDLRFYPTAGRGASTVKFATATAYLAQSDGTDWTSAAGDYARIFRVRSDTRLISFKISSVDAALTGGVVAKCFRSGFNNDALEVTESALGTEIDISTVDGAVAPVELLRDNAITRYTIGQPLWAATAQASDPQEDWDLCVECATNFNDTASFAFHLLYVDGS